MMGPDGAGKTNMISIISGYRWPTIGAVEVTGRKFGETDLRVLEDPRGAHQRLS